MKYTVVSSAEFTYPDIWEYPSASSRADTFAARGSYATFQVLLGDRNTADVDVSFGRLPDGAEPEVYTLTPIVVERNHGIEPDQRKPHYPERVAPYLLYDCLRTFDGTLDLTNGFGGIYVSIKIDESAAPGDYDSSIVIDGVEIPLHLKIYSAKIPAETLKVIIGYRENFVEYHHVEAGSEEFLELRRKYLAMLRRSRQNMQYVSWPKITALGNNKWEFDFAPLLAQIKRYEEAGFPYFQLGSIGGRRSWHEPTIIIYGGMDAMSYEAYCFLSQYIPALQKFLEENDLLERAYMGVADEPNDFNCTTFRALCGLIHKLGPKIRLLDAMSYGNLHGALDVWVPLNAEYDKHMAEIETLRDNGSEIWHYVCCGPREYSYINRFMDYPLLSTRYLHWGNYKYNLTGYLHWAANCYQPGQDPFKLNCPEHHNADAVCYLPAGDTHIVYPGTDGPWMSIRLEASRESTEEYELLCELAKTDKAKADAICDKVFKSFKEVEYDVNAFIENKKALLEALSE
ncbi:MAG: DUF4091 domain-containing protein [Clostridia bacterium]|nr:DUF4091 domain-containing protein [Clostridia bacterium]